MQENIMMQDNMIVQENMMGQEIPKVQESRGSNRCYSVDDLSEILGVSKPTVYNLLKQKVFRWLLIGGKYRISRKSFDDWLDGEMAEN